VCGVSSGEKTRENFLKQPAKGRVRKLSYQQTKVFVLSWFYFSKSDQFEPIKMHQVSVEEEQKTFK